MPFSELTDFSQFTSNLELELQKPLPGEEAQFAMAPYQRRLRKNALAENASPRQSAVLVLFYPFKGEPHTLLMLRKTYPGVHSGQVSFPGGSKDENDVSLTQTALREAEEETGLNKNKVKIIGKLSSVYIPPSGFLVFPFVGYLNEKPFFKPDEKEVEELIEVPLLMILDEKTIKSKNIKLANGMVMDDTPYFDIYGHTVWGATAMMMGELREVLKKVKWG